MKERKLKDTVDLLTKYPAKSPSFLSKYSLRALRPSLDYFAETVNRLERRGLLSLTETLEGETWFDSRQVEGRTKATLFDELLEMWLKSEELESKRLSISSLLSELQSYTEKDELKDFFGSNPYTGKAGFFLGYDSQGVLSFGKPASLTKFKDLSETSFTYNPWTSYVTSDGVSLAQEGFVDLFSLGEQNLTATLLTETVVLSGALCEHEIHYVDVGLMVVNTSYTLKLGIGVDNARVIIKVIAGENDIASKDLVPDAGVTFMHGDVASLPLNPSASYSMVFDLSSNTYLLEEQV